MSTYSPGSGPKKWLEIKRKGVHIFTWLFGFYLTNIGIGVLHVVEKCCTDKHYIIMEWTNRQMFVFTPFHYFIFSRTYDQIWMSDIDLISDKKTNKYWIILDFI